MKKTIIGFVDDKRQYTNDCLNNCLNTTTNNLQEAVKGWEYLLHTTGGKLELTKYACYYISWTFTPHGLPIMIDNNTHTIRVQSSANNSTFVINQLPITSLFEYLGVNSPPSGAQTK